MNKLSHLDSSGIARMVDIGDKEVTSRIAVAGARISMRPETLTMIKEGSHKKGDVFSTARIAGIMAAKRTDSLIPMCHQLNLSTVKVDLYTVHEDAFCGVDIKATCTVNGQTGVEMEALTAATVAALTLYDMCKAVDRGMIIDSISLLEKSGGKSGHFKHIEKT